MPSVVVVTVRGFTVKTTTSNVLYIPATVEVIQWFLDELWGDFQDPIDKVAVVAAELEESDENCDEATPCELDDVATASLEHDTLLMSELDNLTTRHKDDRIKWANSKHAFFVRRKNANGSVIDKFFTVRHSRRCSISDRLAETIWQLERADEFNRTGVIRDDKVTTDQAGNILISVKRRKRVLVETSDKQ